MNGRVSFQVTTPGYTDRYLRHMNSLAYTEVVNASSAATLKADATYTVRPGLADASCYSFESVNFPGQFLRHANSRVQNSVNDGSALLRADATWCARTGLTGTGVSLESWNFRGSFLRHYNAEVWMTDGAGGPAYSNPDLGSTTARGRSPHPGHRDPVLTRPFGGGTCRCRRRPARYASDP